MSKTFHSTRTCTSSPQLHLPSSSSAAAAAAAYALQTNHSLILEHRRVLYWKGKGVDTFYKAPLRENIAQKQ